MTDSVGSIQGGGNVSSARAEQYVTQFEAVNTDFVSTVSGCTDRHWQRQTANEGWPVEVVAHHLAEVYGTFAGLFGSLATGNSNAPTFTGEMIDENNANHARTHAEAAQQETLDLSQTNAAAVVGALRNLRDDQFDDTAFIIDGNPLSAAQVVELALIAHIGEHLASIRATSIG